jgi:AraC-like DNA-binding protein
VDAQLEIISACQRQSFAYKTEHEVWPVYHFHPEFDLLYFKKDQGRVIAGDYIGNFEPGSLFLISPNIPHAFHAEERDVSSQEDAIYVLQFSMDSLGEDLLNKYEMEGIRNFLQEIRQVLEIKGETRNRIAQTIEGMASLSPTSRLAKIILILEILSECKRDNYAALTSPAYTPVLKKDTVSKLDKIINYIIANKSRKITLDEISDLVNMTSKSFCRFFKRNTGKNFIAYVNEIRIGEACKMLLNSKFTISEICHESGFNNISNFNRRFQEFKNMSPREFRLKGKAELN